MTVIYLIMCKILNRHVLWHDRIRNQISEMERIKLIVTLFLILTFQVIPAQEKKWTLEDCINYAVTNNISLQRQRLLSQTAEVNFLKAKMDVLPSLNFGSDARVGFGRSIDPVTNLITFKQNLSNSYSLSSTIQLFNGFTTLNTIAANKFMLKAGLETEKVSRNTLIVDIMGQFYVVLYSKGIEDAAKMQLDLSDKLAYTIASNSTSQALTTLKQMLQLEPGSDFDILLPDMNKLLITDSNYNTDSIYRIATEVLPRLKAVEFELKATNKQVAATWGNVAPRLSVGGSVFTGYYKVISEGSADQASFSSQLKNNNSQAVFLSLDIPIFNNYNTGRNIKLAKIRRNDTELKLQLEKNSLYTEIENACLNFNRGKDEFKAAAANFDYNKKSFDAVEKKFESGLVDVTDYAAAKTTLFRAETEALRTKLQLLIRSLTIQFYSTGEYEKLYVK
jgi:outer membrane protein